jgi:hypothetical protein
MMAALATLAAVGVIVGTAELATHGPGFFIFRENGAGASETGLTDSQFVHPAKPAVEQTTTTPSGQPTK